jgi:hypothetical protein
MSKTLLTKDELVANFYQLLEANKIESEDVAALMRGLITYKPELAMQAIQSSDEQLKQTEQLLKEAQEERNLGKVDRCVESLSRRYSMLLAQIGVVEAQLEECETLRAETETSTSKVRMGTMPCIMLVDFLTCLKNQLWAIIEWDEDKDLADKNIVDYARLASIWVEPSKMWDGKIRFVFRLENYITEADFARLCQKLGKRIEYYNNNGVS